MKDRRLERLNTEGFVCSGCAKRHIGIFDLASMKPDAFPGPEDIKPNSQLRMDGDFLSEDLCVANGEHFFVRSILRLPIRGADADFGFGVWGSLKKENFDRYVEGFDKGDYDGVGPWFSWFANRLKGYPDTYLLKAMMHPRSQRLRPDLVLEPIDHPLVREARDGITLDRLFEIYALNGHSFLDTAA